MTLPSSLFALLCALLMGALFHMLVDGGPGRFALYMILSVVGFGAGQWLASSQGWNFMRVGPFHLGPAVLGGLLVLVAGHWLSKVNVQPVERRRKL